MLQLQVQNRCQVYAKSLTVTFIILTPKSIDLFLMPRTTHVKYLYCKSKCKGRSEYHNSSLRTAFNSVGLKYNQYSFSLTPVLPSIVLIQTQATD